MYRQIGFQGFESIPLGSGWNWLWHHWHRKQCAGLNYAPPISLHSRKVDSPCTEAGRFFGFLCRLLYQFGFVSQYPVRRWCIVVDSYQRLVFFHPSACLEIQYYIRMHQSPFYEVIVRSFSMSVGHQYLLVLFSLLSQQAYGNGHASDAFENTDFTGKSPRCIHLLFWTPLLMVHSPDDSVQIESALGISHLEYQMMRRRCDSKSACLRVHSIRPY